MRRTTKSVAVALLLVVPAAAWADGQDVTGRHTVRRALTVNPVDLFTGTLNIEYEQAINAPISWYAGLGFLYFRGLFRSDTATSWAIGPELGLRFYLFGNAPSGLWLGPYVNTVFASNSSAGMSASSLGWGAGGMLGANFVLGHFNLSLGIGSGWADYSARLGGVQAGLYGFVLRGRFAVGVAF